MVQLSTILTVRRALQICTGQELNFSVKTFDKYNAASRWQMLKLKVAQHVNVGGEDC